MIGENNPFNIRYHVDNHWLGQRGETRGFCNFDTVEHGVRAAIRLVCVTYRREYRIITPEAIISKFAPSSENDTQAYIEFVCKKSGFARQGALVSMRHYARLLHWMSVYEGNKVSYDYLLEMIQKWCII